MDVIYERSLDTVYVKLGSAEFRNNESLDLRRSIDYGVDGTVIGVELFYVSEGIDWTDVPHAKAIRRKLSSMGIVHDVAAMNT
jgi:hypothetical protein